MMFSIVKWFKNKFRLGIDSYRPAVELDEILTKTGLFTSLNSNEVNKLKKIVKTLYFKSGSVILKEGEMGDYFYIIKNGVVRIVTRGMDNNEIVLARLENGNYFGEQALMEDTPGHRNASAIPIENTVVYQIHHSDFIKIVKKDKDLTTKLRQIGKKQFVDKLQKQVYLFTKIDSKIINQLSNTVKEFKTDEIIFSSGDKADGVYYIISGHVAIQFDPREDNIPTSRLSLVTLYPGQMFGELALIKKTTRSGTAIAASNVKLLFIDQDVFLKLYHSNTELQTYLSSLSNIYQIKSRGDVSIFKGKFMGLDSLTTTFSQSSGETFVSNKVVGQNIFTLIKTGIMNYKTQSYHNKDLNIELYLKDKKIVGVLCCGSWSELGETCRWIFDDKDLEAWQQILFRDTGHLTFPEQVTTLSSEDILCNCMTITRGEIIDTIKKGYTEVEAISSKTGAGSVCGSCRPKIFALLGHQTWAPVELVQVIERSPKVRSYQLKPYTQEIAFYQAGQHIVVQALIDNVCVERTYTLTSTPSNKEYYEITVKREDKGFFSNWLFQHDKTKPFMRISPPSGDYIYRLAGTEPLICFIGGVGITPVIGLIRTLKNTHQDQLLYIDFSVHNDEDLIFENELREIQQNSPTCVVKIRITQKQGIITEEEVKEIVMKYPQAHYYICGPKPYKIAINGFLTTQGIEYHNIMIEEFIHAGMPDLASAKA